MEEVKKQEFKISLKSFPFKRLECKDQFIFRVELYDNMRSIIKSAIIWDIDFEFGSRLSILKDDKYVKSVNVKVGEIIKDKEWCKIISETLESGLEKSDPTENWIEYRIKEDYHKRLKEKYLQLFKKENKTT